MVFISVYMPISRLNFSIADLLCRCVQFVMQQKLEQTWHLPWHGFKQNFLGWHLPVHSSTWLYDRSSVQPSNSRAKTLYEEVGLLWKMPIHVRSDRFYWHSAEVCSQCHMHWLRRPLQGIPHTVSLLRRKCGGYWLWEERDIQVAYFLEM